MADTIHFTHTINSELLIGYAQSVSCVPDLDSPVTPEPLVVQYELSNFYLKHRPLSVEIAQFPIEIRSLSSPHLKPWQVIEFGNAYRSPRVSTSLRVQNVAMSDMESATQLQQGICQLLSIAHRGYVFAVAEHRKDAERNWLLSQFSEPSFTDRGHNRAMITGGALEEFLSTSYHHLVAKYQEWNLGIAVDHYLQALNIRSSWPLSLGVFTAMETLKSAFFEHHTELSSYQYWTNSSDSSQDFAHTTEMQNEVIKVLGSYFPRFQELTSSERDSLRSQIKGLNRRSYKTQLRRMLDHLQVSYDAKELQSFVNIRNTIIHQGFPSQSGGWNQIQKAIGLFEKTILAILEYTGPAEFFNDKIGWLEAT